MSERTTKGDYDMYFSGWSLGPDPDYQLFINTCDSRPDADGNGGTSQDGYCNKDFDKLYQQQHVELDEGKRADLVHQALAQHYEDTPSITLWYPNQLEAFRSDRFTGFTKQPTEGGIIANQVGYWGYTSVEPANAEDASGEGGGHGCRRLDRHRRRSHRGHRRRRLPPQPSQEVRRPRIVPPPGPWIWAPWTNVHRR